MDTKRHRLTAFVGLALAISACAFGRSCADDLPPLYVTLVIHTEEDLGGGTVPKPSIPDYDGDEALMNHFASVMRAFAEMASEHGAAINFGSDWTFSRGVERYEPTFYSDLEALGHEIDAHAHESSVLYHDVREAITTAGGNPSHVASGLDEAEIHDRLTYFDVYWPEFSILWGVALPGHTAGECIASWVWRPSRDDWTQHDPEGDYIYIGHGDLVNSIHAVREAVESRQADRVNTIALFTTPREFKAAPGTEGVAEAWTAAVESPDYWENRIAWWNEMFTQLEPLVESGAVHFATLTQIAEAFEAIEDGLSFDRSEVPRSTLGMRQRNARAGYPFE